MNGLQWVVAEAHTHIERQLGTADALDAKAGVLFAYCGALIVAVPSLLRCGAEPVAVVAGGAALIGLILAGLNLLPVNYKDPPDPFKLLDHVIDAKDQPREVIEALIEDQATALSSNKTLIDEKILRFRAAVVFAAIASMALAVEVLVGRGCPGA